jgi:hypothetical protein
MAQLIVVAEATHGQVFVGGGSEDVSDWAAPIITVSVTGLDGTPVKGLNATNFAVHFLPGEQVNPAFFPATVAQALEQVAGVYVLALQPALLAAPPKAGRRFIYAVAVARGQKRTGDHGQTLTTLDGV